MWVDAQCLRYITHQVCASSARHLPQAVNDFTEAEHVFAVPSSTLHHVALNRRRTGSVNGDASHIF